VSVTIRKPSSTPPSERVEAFVAAAGSDARPGHRTIRIELPAALADRLELHCRVSGRDLGALIRDLVEKHLETVDRPSETRGSAAVEENDVIRSVVRWLRSRLERLGWRAPQTV
jgi:hypothetical protein